MTGTIALLALVLLSCAAAWSIRWATRRAFSVSLLKNASDPFALLYLARKVTYSPL